MARLIPKDWHEFQHYKDRDPTWIKLHKKLLDNYKFHRLPVASKALAPMLWLLASEGENGAIDADYQKLGFRLRLSDMEIHEALKPLIDAGFFILEQDASDALANLEREASPEKEKQEASKTQVQTEEIARAARRTKQGSSLPENFPDEKQISEAVQYWLSEDMPGLADRPEHEVAKFRDHHLSKGTISKSWPASWRTWCRNAVDFARKGRGNADAKKRNAHDSFLAAGAALYRESGGEQPSHGQAEENRVLVAPGVALLPPGLQRKAG